MKSNSLSQNKTRILRFNELKTNVSLKFLQELYELNKPNITSLVNDLITCKDQEQVVELVEDILSELKNLNLKKEEYADIHQKFLEYIQSLKTV